ncbi:MAG TPA: fumarylacetoacetate hydrolase family protein, partial [Bacillota bacterium]|nr:fumarylacetoacetate hydrolase family protein [Bacillota bacterium]
MRVRIVKFSLPDGIRWGILEDDSIRAVQGQVYSGLDVTDETFGLDEVKLLAPAHECCGKVIALGQNYSRHLDELNARGWGLRESDEPVVFMVARSALCGHEDEIRIARPEDSTHYEAELVIVIGKRAVDVPVESAAGYILGYTCGNDVSDRVLQQKDGQWTRSKSFSTYKPMGPWIETRRPNDDAQIVLRMNGELKQKALLSDMVFGPEKIVSFLSKNMGLDPGDLIFTGTPAGVGPIAPGDVVEVEIDGIGTLRNTVALGGCNR